MVSSKSLPRLRILVAGGEAKRRAAILERMLGSRTFAVEGEECASTREALQELRQKVRDIAFIDETLADGAGFALLEQIRQLHPKVSVVWTAQTLGGRTAVDALKHGAIDALAHGELESADIEELLRRSAEMHRVQSENAELRLVGRMKDEFLSGVSHELRTPLAVILGYAKTLEDGDLGPVLPHQKLALKTIRTRGERLLQMVNELLAFKETKAGMQQVLLHPLDLRAFLEETLDHHWKTPPKPGLSLTRELPTSPMWVLGDRAKLAEALHALLDNAVKFTASGAIRVAAEPHSNGETWITVRDPGRGIAAEALPRIFEGFFHADKELTRDVPGLGLGLPLARQVVELHGGRLWVESEGLGKGVAARIALPIADPASPEVLVEHRPRAERKRILMVEDNADIIDLLRLFLASFSQNLIITTSRDGLEAVELMAQNTYDMLVLDIMLPQVSGLEVLERIRKSPKNSAVPILVLTGHREAARQAMNIGANDFLLKPFDKSTFIHKVLSLLGMERRKVPRAG